MHGGGKGLNELRNSYGLARFASCAMCQPNWLLLSCATPGVILSLNLSNAKHINNEVDIMK